MARSAYFGKNDILPDFLTDQNSEDQNSDIFRQQIAADRLRDAEESAENNTPAVVDNAGGALADAQSAESQSTGGGFYSGTGKTLKEFTSAKTKAGKIRALIKGGPVAAITVVILVTVFGIFLAGTNLGAQWEDRITRATDPMNTSYAINTTRITKEMLRGERNMPDYMRDRFQSKGILIENDGAGHYTMDFNGQKIDADNFDDIIRNNVEFREAYTKAKRGRVANFFDDAAEGVMKRLGLSRNIFRDYTNTGDDATDAENYHKTIADEFDGDTNTRVNTAEDHTSTDEEGNTTTERRTVGEDLDADNVSGTDATTKARSFLFGTASKVSDAGNIGCALAKVGNLVGVAVAANMLYVTIHYFMNNSETVSKTKSGDGEHSGMNSFLNWLTEEETTSYTDVDTGEEKEVTGAPIEAEGQKFMLSDEKPNQNITKNFTLEAIFGATTAALMLKGYNVKECSTVQATGAIISLSTLFVPGGGIIKATVGSLLKVAFTVGVQVAAAAALSALVPIIARSMFINPAEDLKGKPAGEYLSAGGAATNSRLGRSSSGLSTGNADAIEANAKETAYINHLEAEVERHSRSPFDTSSQYTFFGYLLGQVAAVGLNNSLLRGVASSISLTSRSLANLSKTYADGAIGVNYQTTYGNCPNLESIGIKGDIYCNPIVIADLNTAYVSSNDPAYKAVIENNTYKDEEGKYVIRDGSDLAKYIIYCTERDSPFGVYDANIAGAEETSLGVGDYLPYADDVVDMVNAVENMATAGWADGTYCGNSDQNPYWEGNFEYLQHFIEDQRICTQMGCEENVDASGRAYNPVVAFKEAYYEEHPLDNSREGYLARISGLTKEDATTVLAFYDYQNYLAKYHAPSEMPIETDEYQIALAKNEELEDTEPKPTEIKNVMAVLLNAISYDELRNRSYAV